TGKVWRKWKAPFDWSLGYRSPVCIHCPMATIWHMTMRAPSRPLSALLAPHTTFISPRWHLSPNWAELKKPSASSLLRHRNSTWSIMRATVPPYVRSQRTLHIGSKGFERRGSMCEVISGRPSDRAFNRRDDCFWHNADLQAFAPERRL